MSTTADGERIGPGRLVLVVGPSGGGKDTLIRYARDALGPDTGFEFPRRIVTRAASADEDNLSVDRERFDRLLSEGAIAISWTAHGLSYGLPSEIDSALRRGRTAVCNVSRTVIGALRDRYADVFVVEVTASPAVLARRLESRRRPDDGDPVRRLARSSEIGTSPADVTVLNESSVDDAGRLFLAALTTDRAGRA